MCASDAQVVIEELASFSAQHCEADLMSHNTLSWVG
jgi:hypothetical protein